MFARVLPLALALAASPAPATAAAKLVWQTTYEGSAKSFDWAHAIALDDALRTLYVAGKSSSSLTNQNAWLGAYRSDTGQALWNPPLLDHQSQQPAVAGFGFEEDMGSSVAAWKGGNVLSVGRYTSLLDGNIQTWSGSRTAVGSNGSLIGRDNFVGGADSSGFSYASRGLSAYVPPGAASTGWTVGLNFNSTDGLHYLFTPFTSNGSPGNDIKLPVRTAVDPDWTGDCCYDPPARAGGDGQGNVYLLLGSRYTPVTDYDFLVGRFNSLGSLTVFHYDGSAHGLDVADALVVSTSGAVFILAKTSETGSGFQSRLLAYGPGFSFQWRADLNWMGKPMQDAALALDPSGFLWVVESATGHLLQFDMSGNAVLNGNDQLKFPTQDDSYYIGDILADGADNLYVSGSRNLSGSGGTQAWLARYSVTTVHPVSSPCSAYNFPNPFNSRRSDTTVRYVLPSEGSGRLAILDLLGNIVREWTFSGGQRGGLVGANDLRWDGSDSVGRKVPRGMYVALLSARAAGCETSFRIGVFH